MCSGAGGIVQRSAPSSRVRLHSRPLHVERWGGSAVTLCASTSELSAINERQVTHSSGVCETVLGPVANAATDRQTNSTSQNLSPTSLSHHCAATCCMNQVRFTEPSLRSARRGKTLGRENARCHILGTIDVSAISGFGGFQLSFSWPGRPGGVQRNPLRRAVPTGAVFVQLRARRPHVATLGPPGVDARAFFVFRDHCRVADASRAVGRGARPCIADAPPGALHLGCL